MFTKIIDIESLSDTSMIYDPTWSQQLLKLQNENINMQADIQSVEIGQAHTIVATSAGKLYSYGWNDKFQLGRETNPRELSSACNQINFPGENFRPKSVYHSSNAFINKI